MRRARAGWGVGLLVAVVVTAGCGSGQQTTDEIVVAAASSLTEAFVAIGAEFEAENPDLTVTFNFAGSSALREQIVEGAPVDVFAAADPTIMDQVVAQVATSAPIAFARNELRIAVPAGNPGDVTGLEDFADDELLIGLCAAPVPCGAYGRQLLASAGVVPSVDTAEPNVKSLLTKLEAGELDAGLVYATDVVGAAGRVEPVATPHASGVVVTYPIVRISDSDASAAGEFIRFVLSERAASILAEHGFSAP